LHAHAEITGALVPVGERVVTNDPRADNRRPLGRVGVEPCLPEAHEWGGQCRLCRIEFGSGFQRLRVDTEDALGDDEEFG
jgi:hypothetical protein